MIDNYNTITNHIYNLFSLSNSSLIIVDRRYPFLILRPNDFSFAVFLRCTYRKAPMTQFYVCKRVAIKRVGNSRNFDGNRILSRTYTNVTHISPRETTIGWLYRGRLRAGITSATGRRKLRLTNRM